MGRRSKRAKKNSQAGALACIAGVLLLVAGVTNATQWGTVREFAFEKLGENPGLHFLFVIMMLLASFGGIVVIFGGVLISSEKVRTGRFLLSAGVGMGLVGLAITLWMVTAGGTMLSFAVIGIGLMGVVLSFAARSRAQPKLL